MIRSGLKKKMNRCYSRLNIEYLWERQCGPDEEWKFIVMNMVEKAADLLLSLIMGFLISVIIY